MKKALILAAGVGKRLGDLTRDIPKCLLPIDADNVLIDFSFDALKDINIQEIVFVTGFAEDKLKEHINKKWANKFSVKFVFNDKFAEYNNIYSAYLAKDLWDDEVVLLNSDIIFHPDILKKLKSSILNPQSCLVIDNTKQLNKEDMKIAINEKNEIKRINKNLDPSNSIGEYIGITYLRAREREKFLDSLVKNVKEKKLDLYYEDALDQILNDIKVFPCSTLGKPWTEVDTKEDYEIARKIAANIKTRMMS